ncbi:MAG: Holliday junction branch migration DNA helicase RuvB [Candidatus Brocadiales bacterium]|nr:Holliday junction branch migration DNA helicase RuvB [Candidatus Bathyanammoxibius sp.]MCQ4575293.1 Holliday junction branch migration DNA helicase RuvB [Candidatus Bathyanammoxibius amoris]
MVPPETCEALHPASTSGGNDVYNLRPKNLSEYIGQSQVVESLGIAVEAAKKRADAVDHVLLFGPPGLGKTTLANIIAVEMEVDIVTTSGPALEKSGDLIGILTNLKKGDVLFIDEIHRVPKTVEEYLYSAMEDYFINVIFDKGMNARSYRSRLEEFTMVGATTRAGLLSSPLRERFGIQRGLDFYSIEELSRVIARSASLLGVTIENDGIGEIAKRSRGTPRIANRVLRRVRDYAEVRSNGVITSSVACDALRLEGIDEEGLSILDRKFLETIICNYKGGPVGLEAIAAVLHEEPDTLADMVEPYLLKAGFVLRTPKGRKATERAYSRLGHPVPDGTGGQLPLLPGHKGSNT